MSSSSAVRDLPPAATRDRQWFIVGRWQEFEGEARANLLRIMGIGSFYAVELLNYYGVDLGWLHMAPTVDRQFHLTITALTVAWTMLALATHACLRMRMLPALLKFGTTVGDLVLLTAILVVGDGPRSPLITGYFLILALAALRFQLQLIWCATLGAIVSYLFLLGYAKWYAQGRDLMVPRYAELITLLALAWTGLVLGQVIRRVRAMAEDYAARLQRSTPPGPLEREV